MIVESDDLYSTRTRPGIRSVTVFDTEPVPTAGSSNGYRMTEQDECLRDLRPLIDKADPQDLAIAQNRLLRFALSDDVAQRREEAFAGLTADLTRDDASGTRTQAQRAFNSALLEMVERTREMARSREGTTSTGGRTTPT